MLRLKKWNAISLSILILNSQTGFSLPTTEADVKSDPIVITPPKAADHGAAKPEGPAKTGGDTSKSSPPRTADAPKIFPETYDKLISVLDAAKKDSKDSVEVVGADGSSKKSLDMKGLSEKLYPSIQFLKEYRDKLKTSCQDDDANKAFWKQMDEYVKFLHDSFTQKKARSAPEITLGAPDPKKTGTDSSETLQVVEKKTIAFTKELRKFLNEKAKKFESNKSDFEKSDGDLKKHLNSIEMNLWGLDVPSPIPEKLEESDEKLKKREALFDEKKADADTESVVKGIDAALDALNKADKTCKLDSSNSGSSGASGSGTDKTSKTGTDVKPAPPTGDNRVVVPPVVTGTGAGTGTGTGTGDGTGTGTGGEGLPDVNEGLDPDAEARRQADLERLRAQPDDLSGSLLDDQLLNNQEDELLKALLDTVAAAGRPNNSRVGGSPQKSTQGPSISPSIQGGGGGDKQPQQPPLQPPPQQDPASQFPYAAMMTPPAAPQIPWELFAQKKNYDDEPKKPVAIPQDNANTSALLELARLNAQLLAARQQQQPGLQANNVNNLRNRLAFRGSRGGRGSRFMRRGRGGRTPSRFSGTATSGPQATLGGNPGARTRLPSRMNQ